MVKTYNNWEQSLLEATLTYKKTFAESHNLTLLGGYSFRQTNADGFTMQANDAKFKHSRFDNFL